MAKIYGTPIGGGGTGTNTTLPPLLDNFRAKAKGNISKKGHGEAVNIIDSIESELNGLKLYGKSTQDGTPSPESPVPIVSAGASGSIETTITGKNLLTGRLYYGEYDSGTAFIKDETAVSLPYAPKWESEGICYAVSVKKGVTYTFSVTNPNTNAKLFLALYRTFEDATDPNNAISHIENITSITPSEDGILVCLIASTWTDGITTIHECTASELLQLEIGSTATAYEAPHSQSITISTPNGLPGIPVDSGGNYTDADGQQWVCDEIDFARGKYVQRFKMLEFDGTEDWSNSSTVNGKRRFVLSIDDLKKPSENSILACIMSTHYPLVTADAVFNEVQGISVSSSIGISIYDKNHNTTQSDWISYLAAQKAAGTPVKVVYELETPVETNIPEETTEAYKSLTTYAPVTNIMTDSTPAAGIEIEYASTTMNVELSADKMEESRANELAGAVWVYGDHEPESVNDGTKIQLTREEVVTSDGGEAQTVTKTVEWNNESDFFARQFTYNSKKQYQTMLEGAIATLLLTGIPDPVTELAEQHSGSSITLTWKNPTSDEFYDHTVVVYKTGAFPTAIDDGTQGYTGTDETATLSGLELGSTYYIAVFTVSAYGLYGEPQTVQVEIPAGQLLSSLVSGTKVKLGKWNNTDLQWKVARDTSDQSIRLVLEPTSVSLLGNKQYDAPEPSNSNSDRRNYGNNRYIYSNIHQWLNATKATGWYVAQHSADAAPVYSSSPGFLSGWSENHIAALDRATLTTSRASVDGGGTETFVSRVALMSTTELGLESGTGNGRLDIFNSDDDRATGSYYWTRTPYPSHSSSVWRVSTTGALNMNLDADGASGVRPLCIPVSTALVSPEKDDDNCYIVQ